MEQTRRLLSEFEALDEQSQYWHERWLKKILLIHYNDSFLLSTISGSSNVVLSLLIPVVKRPYTCTSHNNTSEVH